MADSGNQRLILLDSGEQSPVETTHCGNVFDLSAKLLQSRIDDVRSQISTRLKDDGNIQAIFNQMTIMGIDLVPLHIRYVNEKGQIGRSEILKHIREYLGTILRAYELIVEQNVGAICVHEQRSLSDAAIHFVNTRGSKINRADLEIFIKKVQSSQ